MRKAPCTHGPAHSPQPTPPGTGTLGTRARATGTPASTSRTWPRRLRHLVPKAATTLSSRGCLGDSGDGARRPVPSWGIPVTTTVCAAQRVRRGLGERAHERPRRGACCVHGTGAHFNPDVADTLPKNLKKEELPGLLRPPGVPTPFLARGTEAELPSPRAEYLDAKISAMVTDGSPQLSGSLSGSCGRPGRAPDGGPWSPAATGLAPAAAGVGCTDHCPASRDSASWSLLVSQGSVPCTGTQGSRRMPYTDPRKTRAENLRHDRARPAPEAERVEDRGQGPEHGSVSGPAGQ